MIKSNAMASTVSHAENCLYDIKVRIETEGNEAQKEAFRDALSQLEVLYYMLQEE